MFRFAQQRQQWSFHIVVKLVNESNQWKELCELLFILLSQVSSGHFYVMPHHIEQCDDMWDMTRDMWDMIEQRDHIEQCDEASHRNDHY